MTSSIPSASPDLLNAGPASPGSAGNAALLGSLAGTAPVGGIGMPAPTFFQLLGLPNPAATPAAPATVRTNATPPAGTAANPDVPVAATPADPTATNSLAIASWSVMDVSPPVAPPPAKSTSTVPTRAQLEAAASLMAPLWQVLQNLPPTNPVPGGAGPTITVQLGDQSPVQLNLPALGEGGAPLAAGTPTATPAGSPAPAAAPDFAQTVTAEIVAALDQGAQAPAHAAPAAGPPPAAAATPAAGPTPAAGAGEATVATDLLEGAGISAAIALPGGPVLRARVDLSGAAAAAFRGTVRPEKIAADGGPIAAAAGGEISIGEKKILSDGHKEVGQTAATDGISVALSDPTMTATLFERESAADKAGLSFAGTVRPDFAPPAEASMESVTTASLAHRAVATIVSAAEAQTVSRMQPAPSVHLRLNMGGEDLGIKVALRGGEVHTEFQAASPELRAAIAREWQAVGVDSPTRVLKYLQPVYAAGDSSGQGSAAFEQQGQSSQQFSRPSGQDVFGSVGRAYPFLNTDVESPARNDTPVFQPTSLHLSAVA